MSTIYKVHALLMLMLLALTAGAFGAHNSQDAKASVYGLHEGINEAPFGGAVSPDINNYTRAAPYLGMGGKLTVAGVEEAKRLGFTLIIDLRRPEEDGVFEEMQTASRLNILYKNIPLAGDGSVWKQVDEVSRLLADKSNYPILLHCASANRAGAVWALKRFKDGVPASIAIEEGRAVGLKSKELQVRELMRQDIK
ncbi:beta-lactamase hydrolase domain-containing protein [Kordiimonas sp. SCSIO 12610]|uniref:fused DSP-PTPase phosphatase/NAD kinase-like protein n=1 Tax=Kordiimonas sp. SCSIO 12610 TaxID=2829597 RepID=UPI00210B3CA9|nr:sulfur transferase domain-containing protein [Kordiimonas sp. SCSIO 12610]UTW54650.1 hypothetical protein KFF44_12670 [Kordiimonas sp. SCSIO 12610]